MTNSQSHSAVDLDDLAWDEAEALEEDEQLEARHLSVYGFDSDKQTLVGLGPIERARRSRPQTALPPDSERMPQSEPPGPFIADDDDEAPPSFRSPTRAGWLVAIPAVVIAAAAALVLSGGGAENARSKLGRAAVPRMVTGLGHRLESLERAKPEVSVEPVAAPPVAATPIDEPVSESERTKAPGEIVALPVKLPEVVPPVLVDRSSGAEANVGTINVTSNPPASIVLDGRPVGKAPRIVRVPAGIHTLVFIHPLYGRRSLSVNVRAGATTGASADF